MATCTLGRGPAVLKILTNEWCTRKRPTSKLARVRLQLVRSREGQLCCRFGLKCCGFGWCEGQLCRNFWLICCGFWRVCSKLLKIHTIVCLGSTEINPELCNKVLDSFFAAWSCTYKYEHCLHLVIAEDVSKGLTCLVSSGPNTMSSLCLCLKLFVLQERERPCERCSCAPAGTVIHAGERSACKVS